VLYISVFAFVSGKDTSRLTDFTWVNCKEVRSALLGGPLSGVSRGFFIPKWPPNQFRPLSRLGAILATVRGETVDDVVESSEHNLLLH